MDRLVDNETHKQAKRGGRNLAAKALDAFTTGGLSLREVLFPPDEELKALEERGFDNPVLVIQAILDLLQEEGHIKSVAQLRGAVNALIEKINKLEKESEE